MSNYSKTTAGSEPRIELHNTLSLTGAEITINTMAAGTSVPFVHAHKQNEEIYGILSGSGSLVIDNETVPLTEGDWVRIAPQGKRRFFASKTEKLCYICIQVKEKSLEGFTQDDGFICE